MPSLQHPKARLAPNRLKNVNLLLIKTSLAYSWPGTTTLDGTLFYYMIESAIRLREPLDHYCIIPRNGVPLNLRLTGQGWGVLVAIKSILEPL